MGMLSSMAVAMPVTRFVAPGTGGGHADADLAGGAGVAVGHVRGALLVADQDVMDGELAQSVVDGEDGSAGIAEDGVVTPSPTRVAQRISEPVSCGFVLMFMRAPCQLAWCEAVD